MANMEDKSAILNIYSKLSKDIIYYIPAQITPLLISFIGLSVYTRLFSPAEYGDYALVLTTISILGVFTYNWLNNANLRFYTNYSKLNKLNYFFTTTFFLLLVVLVMSIIIYLLINFAGIFYSEINNYILLTIGAIVSISFFETLMTIFRANRKVVIYSTLRCISVISSLLLSLLIIYTFYKDISVLLISVIIINMLLSFIIIIKYSYVKYIGFKYLSREVITELSTYGLPLILTLLSSWITLMSNRYIIGYYRGTLEVGLYSVAVQLADPLSIFSQFLLIAAYPVIIDTWEKHGDKLTIDLISRITKYYLLFAIPVFTGVLIIPDMIMSISGKSFSGGYIVLPWVCFGGLLLGLCYYINKGLELKKNTRMLAIMVGFMALINVGINIILVPTYGYLGAAITTSISYIIYFFISIAISEKYLQWKIPFKTVLNAILCSVLMGLILLAVKHYFIPSMISLIILVMLGALIYVILIYVSGEVRGEVRYVKNLLMLKQK